MKTKKSARDSIEALLSSLPKDKKLVDPLFVLLDQSYGIAGIANLPSVTYNFGRPVASFIYNNSGSITNMLNSTQDHLFEIASLSKSARERLIDLSESFIDVSSQKFSEKDKDKIDRLRQIDRELLDLDAKQWKNGEAEEMLLIKQEIATLETQNPDEYSPDYTIDDKIDALQEQLATLTSEKSALLRERDRLTKGMGYLASTMVHYHKLAQDLKDRKFLEAALSQPKYRYAILKSIEQPLAEDEIGITRNKSGKLVLKSKLGHKEIELKSIADDKELGIPHALFDAISTAVNNGSNLNLTENDLKNLSNFSSMHNFPGVFHHTYTKLMNFLNMPLTMNPADPKMSEARTAMVDGFVELAAQKHVQPHLTRLATQELVDHIFSLPQITPAVKQYEKLVHDLASDQDKFESLLDNLSRSEGLPTYVHDLMDYIGSPPIPKAAQGKEIVNSIEYQQATEKFDKSMLSLIDAVNPDVITAAVSLLDEKLLDNVLALPALKSTEEQDKEAAAALTKQYQDEFTQAIEELKRSGQITENEHQEELNRLKENLSTMQQSFAKRVKKERIAQETIIAAKPPEPAGPLLLKTISMIEGIANNPSACENLGNAMKANSKGLEKAANLLIGPPAKTAVGELLSNFCFTGKEVTDFLPHLCNEKGMKAVAKYIEKPTTLNLVNLFYQTNHLSFAIEHYAKSLTKPLWKKKETHVEKVISERNSGRASPTTVVATH